ncbi:Hypothetical protein CINCED_3A025872 [Cinara cedri]|uniref:Coiled-coil domain-containing protein 40 n=1 Tax=Cinara cedri TaxID=506608 RepID=A0A5E4M8V3_9HEMI|nr:Hypothetical protein CINCED_3A025872 [Cinara cedri]
MSGIKKVQMEKDNYKLIAEEKILNIHNENNDFIEDPNEFIPHQSNEYNNSNTNLIETESETCLNGSESISKDFDSVNSEVTSINNQIIVLEPNNPVMMRFQNTLKHHLLKQRENLQNELLTQDGIIRFKQNEKTSLINEINNIACRVETQYTLLNEFHRMKLELEAAKEQVETYINHGKHRYTEISIKTTVETKKFEVFKRQLDCSQGLVKELTKYEKEQETTFNICNQKKSQAKHFKKKLLNEQQKQDLLLLSLTQEILRLEDRMKQLGEQAETKYNERELLKQKVMDSSTDLDSINGDNTKITLLWNDVLINIQQRDKSFRKIKNDFHYKRSVQEEFHKNDNLINVSNKLKYEQNNLQNSLKICLDKFNNLKDEYSKLIQMTEFQHQNLDQVLFDQKSIQNKINALLLTLNTKSNEKLKYEEDSLDELKKQLFSNSFSTQINNKISELKIQNKEHELVLVEAENNLSQVLLKLEQYRNTSFNLEKDIKENTKYLNDQGFVLSALDSELNKIYTEIKNKSRQIDLENKKLETMKKKLEEGTSTTPQIQIDQVRYKINEVEKKIDSIKQSWVQKQNKNVQLLDQRNKQFNEFNKVCKYASVMDTKNIKIELEIVSLYKVADQYKRTLINMRNTILKLNENCSNNKGKSNQMLNENEWIQYSYLAELKENEKQCLEYMDRLKLLKNELNDTKNVYIEKQRESKSWDSKVQMLVEMKKEIKKKEGDSGDIDAMKNEIHRMQIRESQLKKNLEKIMLDLEACISRREMIYNKVAANDVRLKGKSEAKQKFLKKLDDLRLSIKKIKMVTIINS